MHPRQLLIVADDSYKVLLVEHLMLRYAHAPFLFLSGNIAAF